MKLILPAALGAGAVQVNLAVSTALAGLSARRRVRSPTFTMPTALNQLPLGLIGIGLGTILLPTVSRLLSAGATQRRWTRRTAASSSRCSSPCRQRSPSSSPPSRSFAACSSTAHFTRPTRAVQLGARRLLDRPALLRSREGPDARAITRGTTPGPRCAMRSSPVGVNLVGNLVLIPLLGRFGFGHVGPPLATAVASTVNVWMLYRTLSEARPFRADAPAEAPHAAPRDRGPDHGRRASSPCASCSIPSSPARSCDALRGARRARRRWRAVYAIACFFTGAFVLDDVKLLLKRRAREA